MHKYSFSWGRDGISLELQGSSGSFIQRKFKVTTLQIKKKQDMMFLFFIECIRTNVGFDKKLH